MIHIEKSRTGKGWIAHLSGAWPVTAERDWPRNARYWRRVLEWDGRMHVLVAMVDSSVGGKTGVVS